MRALAKILAPAVLLSPLATGAEMEFKLPPPVAAGVKHALEMADLRVPSKNPVSFTEALDQLAKTLDAKTVAWARENEGKNLEAKVIWLAAETTARPKLLPEIHDYYFKNGAQNYFAGQTPMFEKHAGSGRKPLPVYLKPHVLTGPQLRPEHLTAEYRSAWEVLTLLLSFESTLDRNSDRLMEALASLGNKNTATVLEHRCRPARQLTVGTPYHEFYRLAALPDQNTVRVWLNILTEWQRLRPKEEAKVPTAIPGLSDEGRDEPPSHFGADWTQALATAKEALGVTSRQNREMGEAWKAAVGSFATDELSPAQLAIFHQLKAALK